MPQQIAYVLFDLDGEFVCRRWRQRQRSKYMNQGLLLDTERIDTDVVSAYSASIHRRDDVNNDIQMESSLNTTRS
jgi:hypothetical protein